MKSSSGPRPFHLYRLKWAAWTIGTRTKTAYSRRAGARKSAMVSHRAERPGLPVERPSSACIAILPLGSAEVDRAGRPGGSRPARSRCESACWRRLLGGCGVRDRLADLGRIRTAQEEGDGRIVDRRAHRGRGRLVEVQLHELGLAARVEDGLEVRVAHGALGADGRGQADAIGVELRPVLDAVEEFQEVERLGRRVLADGDAIAATDAVGRCTGAAG